MTRAFMKTHAFKGLANAFALAVLLIGIAANSTIAGTLLVDSLRISAKDKIVASGKAEHYDRSSIFEYSDGGADVYLDGGFATCLVRQYDFQGAVKGSLEIAAYDMTTPLKVLGLFQTLAEGHAVLRSGIMETMSDIRREVFHKGAWLVEIVDKSDKVLPVAALAQTAAALAAVIPDGPAVPTEYSWLPKKGKVSGSERYYHRNFLSRSYLLCALTARYTCAAVPCTLFISQHDSLSAARKDMQKLAASISTANTGDTLFTPTLTAVIKGPFLIGVTGIAPRKNVMDLIKACIVLLPTQQNSPSSK
jgi:hypothetical protein